MGQQNTLCRISAIGRQVCGREGKEEERQEGRKVGRQDGRQERLASRRAERLGGWWIDKQAGGQKGWELGV